MEGAYSVTLAGHVFEGRIDAVFRDGDGWFVVDWKTGRRPSGAELASAELQLAVYRLAWAKVQSVRLGRPVPPESVRAAFHYVLANETYEPGTLPTSAQLAALIGQDHGDGAEGSGDREGQQW